MDTYPKGQDSSLRKTECEGGHPQAGTKSCTAAPAGDWQTENGDEHVERKKVGEKVLHTEIPIAEEGKRLYFHYIQYIPVIVPEVGPPKNWHYKQ